MRSLRVALLVAAFAGLAAPAAHAGFSAVIAGGNDAAGAGAQQVAYRGLLSPRAIVRLMREEGYENIRVYRRQGPVYPVDVDDGPRRYRLEVDARSGEILDSTVIGYALGYGGRVPVYRPAPRYVEPPQRFFAPPPRYVAPRPHYESRPMRHEAPRYAPPPRVHAPPPPQRMAPPPQRMQAPPQVQRQSPPPQRQAPPPRRDGQPHHGRPHHQPQ